MKKRFLLGLSVVLLLLLVVVTFRMEKSKVRLKFFYTPKTGI